MVFVKISCFKIVTDIKIDANIFYRVVFIGGKFADSDYSRINKSGVSFWPPSKPLESKNEAFHFW